MLLGQLLMQIIIPSDSPNSDFVLGENDSLSISGDFIIELQIINSIWLISTLV